MTYTVKVITVKLKFVCAVRTLPTELALTALTFPAFLTERVLAVLIALTFLTELVLTVLAFLIISH